MSGFNAKRLGSNLQSNFVIGLGRNRCAVGSITREYNYLNRTSQAPFCSLFSFNCSSPQPPGPTVPTAPTIINATPFATSIEIGFTQSSNGGSVITNYEYTMNAGTSWTPFSPNITSSPAIVSGLTTGQTYNINIRAVNAIGAGPASTTVTQTTVETIVVVNFTTVGSTGWDAPSRISSVEYLVVAGGGGSGGGFDTGGGGGGGGGMVLNGTISVTPGTIYAVTVGDGGAGGISQRSPVSETPGSPGDNSVFSSITAIGGGGGYASRFNSGVPSSGGSQVSGSTASGGGSGGGSAGDGNGAGGGGGGNTSNGSNGVTNTGGAGGAGIDSSISGSSATYGVGGQGANGNVTSGNTAVAGAANTGNGARGGGTASSAQTNGAKGGSGIVTLKYSY
jgi:hypothetical protein